MFREKIFRWEYFPASVALIAAGVLLMAPYVKADPAILKGANGVACQIPNSPYGALRTQLDVTPNDGDDVEINTNPSEYDVLADGECTGKDVKQLPAYVDDTWPSLPYEVKYNYLNKKGKVFCRMEDSDNTVYYTRRWKSVLKVEQTAPNNVTLTYKLICLDGYSK